MGTWSWCALSLFVAAGATADAAPAAGELIAVTDLGWPAGTVAATLRHGARVLDRAGGKRIGTVAGGTRVTWTKIVASKDGCGGWLALEPRGWACAHDLAPAVGDLAPPGPAPHAPGLRWADIGNDGADAYDDLADLRVGKEPARHVGDRTYVSVKGGHAQLVAGTRYFYTDQGWIAGKDLTWYEPSPFAGVELAVGTPLDFGWAVALKPGAKILVHDAPDPSALVVRKLDPRDLATVREVRGAWARIGDAEWTLVVELRRPELRGRPDGVAPGERWLDVDLDQQVLVAYDGDVPAFTTVVSTGRTDWQTPTGIYRIRSKAERTRMQDPGNMADTWNVADVPWAMSFRRNFALHGTYWHDGFGRARSHGCVNLSPNDAKRVYDFVTPIASVGWTDAEISAENEGTPVQIRSRRDPTPKWTDYEGKASQP